jgi:hypothetical protein
MKFIKFIKYIGLLFIFPFVSSIEQLYEIVLFNLLNLENNIDNSISNMKTCILKIKMNLLLNNIHLLRKANDSFETLKHKHIQKIKQYEILLNSLGLSPAREDEMYLIEEMEKVAFNHLI